MPMDNQLEETIEPSPEPTPVSTGHLPPVERVQALVNAAYERYKSNDEGRNADHYPALTRVPPELFGVCIVGVDGALFAAGEANYPFTIMSVSKPFIFALVAQVIGAEQVREKIGANSTGLPFNSVLAIELHKERTVNPMVNAGAIAATSLAPGATADAKWRFIHEGLSRFAGRELSLNEEVYASASARNCC